MFFSSASALPATSTITEWSITRSTGTSGFTRSGLPPSATIPSRIAARSTTPGTPVKSCIKILAGLNGTSLAEVAFSSHPTIALASSTL